MEWKTIETAPKDGNHILLYRPNIQFVGYWSNSGWIISAPDIPIMKPEPTHWMPLPRSPWSSGANNTALGRAAGSESKTGSNNTLFGKPPENNTLLSIQICTLK